MEAPRGTISEHSARAVTPIDLGQNLPNSVCTSCKSRALLPLSPAISGQFLVLEESQPNPASFKVQTLFSGYADGGLREDEFFPYLAAENSCSKTAAPRCGRLGNTDGQ